MYKECPARKGLESFIYEQSQVRQFGSKFGTGRVEETGRARPFCIDHEYKKPNTAIRKVSFIITAEPKKSWRKRKKRQGPVNM